MLHTTKHKATQQKQTPSWQKDAERMAPIYRISLDNGGDLTLTSTAPGDIYESNLVCGPRL